MSDEKRAKKELRQPQIGVGAVVIHKNRVLLVKRKNPPAENLWAIPGGKLQFGETLRQAAEREILEETGVLIKAGEIVHTFEIIDRDAEGQIRYHYIIIDLSGEYISGDPSPDDDALEARWISKEELKNFPVNKFTRELLRKKFNF